MILLCAQCHRELPLQGRAEGESLVCPCGQSHRVPRPQPFHAPVWHCGSCGAGLAVGAKDCGYCGTGLKPLDGKAYCARCLAYLEKDAAFCSHCGAHASDASAMPQATDLACPRCGDKEKLAGVPVGYHHGEACFGCEGLWLSQSAFGKVVRDFSAPEKQRPAATGLAHPGHNASLTGPDAGVTRVVYLPCPVCGVRMARQNYLRVSGIILDACPEHGIWFDREELRRVAAFLQTGGTVKAQQMDLQRAKEAQRHASAVASLEKGAAGAYPAYHSWPLGVNDAPSAGISQWALELLGEAAGRLFK